MKRFVLAAAACWLMAATPHSSLAQSAPAAAQPAAPARQALQFRRVFAPLAEIKDWPLADKYLPMDAKEFQRLIEIVHHDDQGAPRTAGALLRRTEYHAHLLSPDVLEGEALLSIEHRSESPVLLPLEPFGLAISEAAWVAGDSPAAVLGRSSGGRVGVMVDRSADLKLHWSLRGDRGAAGDMTFALDLPACAAGRLTLDLPVALVPSVDRGLVRQRERSGDTTRRWSIDLDGSHRIELRLISSDSANLRKPLALVRQTTAYEFSPRGVDVSVQLRLDVHDVPLERLTVQIDPRLQLVGVHYADRDIPWTTSSEPASGGTQAILELPEPISGIGRIVRLSALATLEEGQSWRLPMIRAEETTWLEGITQLVVPKPLVVQQLIASDCRQSKAAPLGAPLSGESLEFQCFSQDCSIDVVVGRPREELRVETASAVEVSPAELTSRTVAQISLLQSEEFALHADVGPQWVIDSVEAGAPETIEDWQVDTPDGRPRRLAIHLKLGVSPQRPVRLTIVGHRPAQTAQLSGLNDLEMLRFSGAQRVLQWMALRASDAHELQLSGGEDLVRLDPQQFTLTESQLFAEPPTGLVFAITPAAERLRVGTAPRKPVYTGDINIDVMVDARSLTETFTFRCQPQGSRLDRVLVFCSHARGTPLRFSLAGGSSGQISARALPVDQYVALGAAPGGEVWEITLRLPRSGAFEIRGVRTIALSAGPPGDKTPVSLAALPEATGTRGTLTIRALGETSVAIDNQRLKPIPAEQLQADFYQTARGEFRYDPTRDAANAAPAISIAATGSSGTEMGAWVWQARLDSRYALRESTIHSASWRVQTAGRSQICFTLPSGAELRSAAVDDAPLAEAVIENFGEQFTIDLPPGKQFATIALSFVTSGELPRLTRSLAPAWPDVDIPVLNRRWKLWLPAGYELSESDDRWDSTPLEVPTWSQRLLGPLGRPQRARIFDPFSVESWDDSIGHSPEDLAARASGQQFSSALSSALLAAESRQSRLSWKELFSQVSSTLATADIAAYADMPGLDQIALNADGLVPRTADAADRSLGLLRQAKLFVLCGPRVVVLTSEPAVADYRAQLEPTSQKQFGRLMPGSLATSLESDGGGANLARAVHLAQWSGWSSGRRSPWRSSRAAISPAWESRGWTSYTLSWGDGPGQPVRVVSTAAMQSLAWAIFLLTLALAVGRFAGRLPVLVLLAALSAAAALISSPTFAPLAAAAFLGALCSVLYSAIDWQTAPREPLRTQTPSRYATAGGLLLVLTALSLAGSGLLVRAAEAPLAGPSQAASSDAQPPGTVEDEPPQLVNETDEAEQTAEHDVVPKIFVPVDEAQQPVGPKVYVPLEFYNNLLRQAAAASEQAGDWLLMRAAYHATLSPLGAQKNIGIAELRATFDLQVLRTNVEVKLPLGNNRISLVPDSAKLDGRPLELHWSETHHALTFVAEQAGVFRLELGLVPVLRREDSTTGFELTIPPLPGATLSVTMIGEPVAVEVHGARGAVSAIVAENAVDLSVDRELHADLGPTDRIDLRWPDETNLPASLPNLDVEELIWVKLQPGSPIIDARFKFHIVDGRVHRVRILADPRLRLLPSWNAASPVTGIHIAAGDPDTIELELSAETGDRVDVDLTFLVAGTSGIGNFHLPRLEAAGARLTGRMLAVTLDPALHWEEQMGDEVRPLAPADFAAAWGESNVKPQLVYAIPRGEAAWSLATRPRETRSVVEQTTRLVLGPGTAHVDLSATINTTAGHNFQLRLVGPAGLEIDSVSLLDDGVEQVARWAKDEAGTITAFLGGPLAGRQQFAVRGRLLIPTAGEHVFACFQWPGAEVKKSQLQIFRHPQTLVAVEPATDMTVVENTAADRNRPELGRLIASLLLDSTTAQVKLRMQPNTPEIQAREIIFVERDQEVWSAIVDYHVTVSAGLLDALRFEIPPQWTEPYQIEPAAKFEIVPIPGESRRQLVLYPLEPIADQYHVRIRGRLVPSLGDRLRAPDIVPRGAGKLERFIALTNQWEAQQVDWEKTGLAKATAPADWRPQRGNGQSTIFYHVLGEHFQAVLKGIDRPSGRPRVRLADIHAAWHADGAYAGVASFDLDPAGSSAAILNLPSEIELVHLSVAGLPVAAAPAGPGSWHFELGSTQLPQRIEAIFRGSLAAKPDSSRYVQVPAPGIDGIDVERTLWTVYGPATAGVATPPEPAGPLTAIRQELARLQATVSLLDLASPIIGQQSPDEILRWYGPWKAHFVAARNRMVKLMRASGRPNATRNQELDVLNRQQVAIAERLGYASGLPDDANPAFDPARLFDGINAVSEEPARCLFEGDAPTLTLRYASSSRPQFLWRLLAAAAAVALAFLLSSALPGRKISIAPWPLVLSTSLFAWLCLMPSALGFVVMISMLALAAARSLRRRLASSGSGLIA